ncbi:hypothetical protein [Haloarchaeobius amylolyticus]|uniref:hypothetical protein n=1 Tax=Haloarchaeobius amylolyticus TaxID=1198296 RepID=UPI00226ECB2E|nr:hypothetical protein [Haloarchaeobius amylolyticus]
MSTLERFRDDAYTGERRCWPCTVVNVGIVGLVVAAAIVLDYPVVAGVVGVVGLGAIWARGYVVPYTPRFAPQLVAALPIGSDPFHADGGAQVPDEDGTLADEEMDGETVLTRLVEAGVVVPEGEDLVLADDFYDRWHARMDAHREASAEELAGRIRDLVPGASVSVEDGARGPYVVVSQSGTASLSDAWLTRPVAIAEVAAVEALDGTGLDEGTRLAAAEPLRTFLDVCPDCGGAVEVTTTVECCGGSAGATDPDEVLACTECDTRLFTFPN